jgi:Protein of unknown function (DUF3426)
LDKVNGYEALKAMHTQCPNCRKTYPIPKKNARGKKAQIYCVDCKKKFDVSTLAKENASALVAEAKAEFIPKPASNRKKKPEKKLENQTFQVNLSAFLKKDSPSAVIPNPVEPDSVSDPLPWEVDKKEPLTLSMPWLAGFISGLLLLLGQIIYFERHNWSQNPVYRPNLEKLCSWLGCKLPNYESLNELAVLQGSFTPNTDNTIVFKAVINNQAAFNQKLPNIKLTLLDYNEQVLAQRIFLPKEYLAQANRKDSLIAADQTLEASLTIISPKTPIGGYNFDLVY